ncbi:CPSF A subunit region-domain-containing protein [Syncephalis plumigaleata]|nr:CPSF A subunit region-domain-containing protein [Syncephalis plumigaleata]
MAYNYVATAYPATATLFAVRGSFTGPEDTNLIIGRTNRIEVYQLTADGLALTLDFSIYGRLASLNLLRVKNIRTELIVFTTEKHRLGVLARMIVSLLYQGMLNVIPINQDAFISTTMSDTKRPAMNREPSNNRKRKSDYDDQRLTTTKEEVGSHGQSLLGESCNISLEELLVLDVAILHTTDEMPLLAVLYQDSHFARHVKTYHINMTEQELVAGPWSYGNVDRGAETIVPLPLPVGGLLVLGMTTIIYVNENGQRVTTPEREPSAIECYGYIGNDKSRILLANHLGHLFMLAVVCDRDATVMQLELKKLGQVSIPTTVTYLDNRYVYIGSHLGDSQLVHIDSEPGFNGDMINMCTVEQGLQMQECVITCSGGYEHGSLKIIRNGIGFTKQALLDLPDITGIWSISNADDEEWEETMILSFINETRILRVDEDQEMAELDTFGDYQLDEPTLYTGNMHGQLLVQITPNSIRLLTLSEGKHVFQWTPTSHNLSDTTNNSLLTDNAPPCGNKEQIVVALSGGIIYYFELNGQTLVEKGIKTLDHDVACLGLQHTDTRTTNKAKLLAIGLWTDNSLLVYDLSTWQQVAYEQLSANITPRSVLLVQLEDHHYAMLIVMNCHPETGHLSNELHVFAASDRTTIIYSVRQRLVFAGIKLREAKSFCSFNAQIYPGCMAIVNAEGVVIGAVDGARKLHIQNVPLHEMPRRLCYHSEKELIGALTIHAMDLEDKFVESREEERSYFHLLDAMTFDALDHFQMNESELVTTLALVPFASQNNQSYFVVGTGFTYDGDMYEELTDGRILVFATEDRKRLVLKAELRVPGGVFQVVVFNGLLLACVSNRVCLYNLLPNTEDKIVGERLQTACISCSVRGDFIAVGDLLRSVTLLRYIPEQQKLAVLAQDYTTHWTCSVTMLSDDTILATDSCYNIYALKYQSDDPDETTRETLENVGQFHIGDQINRFYRGSLATWVSDTAVSINLSQLQSMPGDIEHSSKEAKGFIDGDLVEQFLQLSTDEQVSVIEGRIANISRNRHQLYHSKLALDATTATTDDDDHAANTNEHNDDLMSDEYEENNIRPLNTNLTDVISLLEELARWH